MPKPNDVGVGTALVIRNDQNQVLMFRRKGAHASGTWCFPGGWIDRTDDTLELACIREAAEEVGLDITEPVSLLGVTTENFQDFRSVTIYYWTRLPVGAKPEILEPHKACDLTWVTVSKYPEPVFPSIPKMWPLIKGLTLGGVSQL